MAPRPIHGLYQQFVDNFGENLEKGKMRIKNIKVINSIHKIVIHNVNKNVDNFKNGPKRNLGLVES